MKERNKIIIQMVIAIIGVIAGLVGVNAFNRYLDRYRDAEERAAYGSDDCNIFTDCIGSLLYCDI